MGLAVAIMLVAWLASLETNIPLRDPNNLGLRLPLIMLLFYLADVVPRVLIKNRGFSNFFESVTTYTRQRWTRTRLALGLTGVGSFYVIYLAYRNLKSLLPVVRDPLYDPMFLKLDKAFFFGHDPASVLHTALGTGISAHILSLVYMAFLLFTPLSVGAALVWSKRVSTGFWYVVAVSINWVLGVLSYYWLPSQGPAFAKPSLFADLPDTGVTSLQASLLQNRIEANQDPLTALNSIAAFASLHVSIIFTAVLIIHLVVPNVWVRTVMWVYFALTALSTIYFGWHYLLDDFGGLVIGLISVWVAARMTGHRLRRQRTPSQPGDGLIGVFPPKRGSDAADQPAASTIPDPQQDQVSPPEVAVDGGDQPDDRRTVPTGKDNANA